MTSQDTTASTKQLRRYFSMPRHYRSAVHFTLKSLLQFDIKQLRLRTRQHNSTLYETASFITWKENKYYQCTWKAFPCDFPRQRRNNLHIGRQLPLGGFEATILLSFKHGSAPLCAHRSNFHIPGGLEVISFHQQLLLPASLLKEATVHEKQSPPFIFNLRDDPADETRTFMHFPRNCKSPRVF